MRRAISFLSLCLIFMLAGCDSGRQQVREQSPQASGKLVVMASNLPLATFAEAIGGEHVEVIFPQMSGDPANWLPGMDDVLAMQQADLLLTNGAGYEGWLDKVMIANEKVVDTTRNSGANFIITDATVHSHGPEGEHSHDNVAFTTWLDMQIAIAQANVIRTEFMLAEPKLKTVFQQNFEVLKEKLEHLDSDFKQAGNQLNGVPVVYSHPVYQYFSNAYQINGKAVHWEPEQELSDSDIRDFLKVNRSHGAKLMIWEGQPSEENSAKLAGLGVQSVVFNPAGNGDKTGFFAQMELNLKALAQINYPELRLN